MVIGTPIVTVAWNAERYQSRNLALRLVALGYTNVYWYRGGREAWEVAGLPETDGDAGLVATPAVCSRTASAPTSHLRALDRTRRKRICSSFTGSPLYPFRACLKVTPPPPAVARSARNAWISRHRAATAALFRFQLALAIQ